MFCFLIACKNGKTKILRIFIDVKLIYDACFFRRIPTVQKFRTLFRIWDIQRVGYLTPGTLVGILRDVYDILGLSLGGYQKEAIQLFKRLDTDRDCRWVGARYLLARRSFLSRWGAF